MMNICREKGERDRGVKKPGFLANISLGCKSYRRKPVSVGAVPPGAPQTRFLGEARSRQLRR
ncbi:MAG: hypothetical protein RLZZ338_4759 [Cyanobacteriota bacterium]|jgi:hypothetical protein